MPGDSAAGFLPVSGGTFMEQSFLANHFQTPPCWKVGLDFLTGKNLETMSKAKFTKGPYANQDGRIVSKKGHEIGWVNSGARNTAPPSAEWPHNGNLFAAAPELYEALEDLLTYVYTYIPEISAYPKVVLAIDAAELAIAKANGEK